MGQICKQMVSYLNSPGTIQVNDLVGAKPFIDTDTTDRYKGTGLSQTARSLMDMAVIKEVGDTSLSPYRA